LKICVVGSINMDLVAVTDYRPAQGETVMGKDFVINPGGKGANQAVSVARLGAEVFMLGCVGNDYYGSNIIENFNREKVNTKYIKHSETNISGIAHIVLANNDNSIIVIPGANNEVNKDYIDSVAHIICDSDLVLTQLEIPIDTALYLSQICKSHNVPFLLNPAPAVYLPQELIDNSTYITPNENEIKIIFQDERNTDKLLKDYPNKLIVTLGDKGVMFCNGEEIINIPSTKVPVIDTTGAGDTFNGSLAWAICRGMSTTRAIEFANIAAGLSITKIGAQKGMPTLTEVQEKWNEPL
jgi:ribokinase